MRVFLATAKGDTPSKVDEWTAELRARLPSATIVDGVTDWTENFGRCGGWNGWAMDVAQGRDINGRARFDAFVCPYEYVGKATAQIVGSALAAGKPVLLLRRDGTVAQVMGVTVVDPESWKAGWMLVVVPPAA